MSSTSPDAESGTFKTARQEVDSSIPRTLPLNQVHQPHVAFPKDDPAEFGGYRVLEAVGHGGMGVVYRAIHETLGREVALKVLSARIGDESSVELRFRQEARAVARLHHSNIVPLFEVGESDGHLFLAMQLIEGNSLDKVIKRDRVTSATQAESPAGVSRGDVVDRCRLAASIGRQAAEALAYAHGRGIIHRDVKPSNLIVDSDDVAWLTDFGLAKFDGENLTQTGECIGTIPYMSPEQLEGNADHRTDVYSLGVALFEFVTLKQAFEDSDQWRLIDRIKVEQVSYLRDINDGIPDDFATVVARATDPDPALRYQTAQEFANDLQRFTDGQPVLARRHSRFALLMRWAQRNTELAMALTGIAALMLLLFAGAVWFSIRQNALRAQADIARNDAVASETAAKAAYADALLQREKVQQHSDELQRSLYLSEMNVAAHAIVQPFGGPTVAEKTSHWIPAPGETDLRGWEWHYLHAISHQARFASEPFNFWVMDVEPSPDGKQFAVAMNNGGIHIRDSATGDILRLTEMPSRSLSWSSDGTRLAVSDYQGKVSICDAETLEPLHVVHTGKHSEVFEVCWSPDGKHVAVCGDSKNAPDDFSISIYDAKLEDVTCELWGHSNIVYDIDWSPDGKHIASASYDESVRVWNVQTEQTTATWKGGGDLCWNRDGRKLATSSPLAIWDVGADEPQTQNLKASCLAWCPDSEKLAVGRADGTVEIRAVATGQVEQTFYGHANEVWAVCWPAGGGKIVSGGHLDETFRIWDATRRDRRELKVENGAITCLDWSPDDTRLAACTVWPASVSVWGFENGESQDSQRVVEGDTNFVAFDNSSQLVVYAGLFEGLISRDLNSGSAQTVGDDHTDALFVHSTGMTASLRNRRGTTRRSAELLVTDSDGEELFIIPDVHTEAGSSIHINNAGTQAATTGIDGFLRVWDLESQSLLWETEQHVPVIQRVRWNNEGNRLATTHPGYVTIWDAANGSIVSKLDDVHENFLSLDWHPSDTRLATASNVGVCLWDISLGRVALKLPKRSVNCVRWSHDGRRLAAGGESTVTVWDASAGYAGTK